jgi:glycosyltransferase involved in cell wall biosynthesis
MSISRRLPARPDAEGDDAFSKRKLLLVTDEMEVGGSQRQITQLLLHLDQARFAPVLAYFRNPSHLLDQLSRGGIPTVLLPKRRPVDARFFLSLLRFLRRERFDVVHAFAFTAELWTAAALLLCPGTRLITSIRGEYESYGLLRWRLKRWITRRSYRVVSNSALAAAYAFRQMAMTDEKLCVVHNGVHRPPDEALCQPETLRPLKESGRWLLTFVGRLVRDKNLPCLLRAMHRLAARAPAVTLLIVGDGEDRVELERQARSLGLRAVHFLGQRSDVEAVLSWSDAAVLPSFTEGLSNTLLEAMASGLPVVASRVGGNPEVVVSGETGLLFESDDDAALAARILDLYEKPALASRLGSRARDQVEMRFSVAGMVAQFERLYSATDEGGQTS